MARHRSGNELTDASWQAVLGLEMGKPLDEILSQHEAATACCDCCDSDYACYVDQTRTRPADETNSAEPDLPPSAASKRRSVRFIFERLANHLKPGH